MTAPVHQQEQWYHLFLATSRQASERAAFEVAYHSLAAAMHCAKDLDDLVLMRSLLQEVERQKQHLDRTAPEHSMSTISAAGRGHESSYTALERQLGVLIRFRESDRYLKKRKSLEEEK